MENKPTQVNAVDEAINNLEICLNEAPVDFLGTGSDSNFADKEYDEWKEIYTKVLKVLREWQSKQTTPPTDIVDEDSPIKPMYDIVGYAIDVDRVSKEEVELFLSRHPQKYIRVPKDLGEVKLTDEQVKDFVEQMANQPIQWQPKHTFTLEDIEKAWDAGVKFSKNGSYEITSNGVNMLPLNPTKEQYIQSIK